MPKIVRANMPDCTNSLDQPTTYQALNRNCGREPIMSDAERLFTAHCLPIWLRNSLAAYVKAGQVTRQIERSRIKFPYTAAQIGF